MMVALVELMSLANILPWMILDSNGNATMPTATTDVYAQSSATFAPFVEGRFTSLLLGVDREAKLSTSAKKFHFD